MNKRHTGDASRRTFLKGTLALSAMTGGPFLGNLYALGSAAAQSAGDFKALVCVFQYGGNDQSNIVLPREGSSYQAYYDARPTLALNSSQIVSIAPTGYSGAALGMPNSLSGLAGLFESGRAGIVANVGPLVQPTTRAQILAETAPLPRQLFSHSDQQGAWQTGAPTGTARTGWLGRIGDLLAPSFNPGAGVSVCMSTAGYNTLQVGETVLQYQLTRDGALRMVGAQSLFDSEEAGVIFRQMMSRQRGHALEAELSRTIVRSLDTEALVTGALAGAPPLTTEFPETGLGAQLQTVARMIAVRSTLSQRRQIYFVASGGWDFHDNLLEDQAERLTELDGALTAFYNATVELGVANAVTAFTASDFGRALQFNGRGSDHGWGGHHFVVGGAVRGRRIFGTFPDVALGTTTDAGQGRLLPTTSVDEFAAELASWFGVSNSDLSIVMPNLSRFERANMDFLA